MNKTFEVVKEWAAFEEKHPNGSIEDFCRDYIIRQHSHQKEQLQQDMLWDVSCDMQYALSKSINRLARLWNHFALAALKEQGLTSFDEFAFLYTVDKVPHIRKKDLTYMHFIEISSGLLVMERLLKKGLLTEETDTSDKRSKRLSITPKGKEALIAFRQTVDAVAAELYGGMPEADMALAVQLLTPLEERISEKWHQLKNFEPASPER
jgi:DNA-binding MarR family transcriptional regulator